MKKSIVHIKGVTVLNKNQQSLLASNFKSMEQNNCYPVYDYLGYYVQDECYWE